MEEKYIEEFRETLEKEGRSTATVKNYVYDVRYFNTWAHDNVSNEDPHHREAGGLDTPQQVFKKYAHHLKSSGAKPSTINRRIQSLKSFYNVMLRKGYVETNPVEGIKASKVSVQNETKWLDRKQVKAIFKQISAISPDKKRVKYHAIFSIFVNCGLRVEELTNLKTEHIDFKTNMLTVYSGKGDKFRYVPLNSATKQSIVHWLHYREDDESEYLFPSERQPQMTTRSVQHMAQKLNEGLNFSFSVHQLRHTFLKNVADTTGKIELVASLAGHDSVETSRRYIEPSLKEIAEAMEETEFNF